MGGLSHRESRGIGREGRGVGGQGCGTGGLSHRESRGVGGKGRGFGGYGCGPGAKITRQTAFHMEWCLRDLNVVAVEVLKWSIGARSEADGDRRQMYTTRHTWDVQIGALTFQRPLADYKDFSQLIILERNHLVHFGSLKVLEERVTTALQYIKEYEDFLVVSKRNEVEVIQTYEKLKEALPHQFR